MAADIPLLRLAIVLRSDQSPSGQMASCLAAGQAAGPSSEPPLLLSLPDATALAAARSALGSAAEPVLAVGSADLPDALVAPLSARSQALLSDLGALPWKPAPDLPRAVVEATSEPLAPKVILSPAMRRQAALLFCLSRQRELLFDTYYDLARHPEEIDSVVARLERENDIVDSLDALDEDSPEFWEARAEIDRFSMWMGELDGIHCGDCTAVAAPCCRCHAERFVGVSTCPESKHEGHRLLGEYSARAKAAATQDLPVPRGPAGP